MILWTLFSFLALSCSLLVFASTSTHLRHLSKDERKEAEKKARPNQKLIHDYREKEILKRDDGKYIEDYFFVRNILNPSIMQLNQSRILICWRTNMYKGSHLKYGWLDLDSLSHDKKDGKKSTVISKESDFPLVPYIPGLGVPRQNEARILVMNDGRITFTYAGNVKYKQVTQHVSFAHLNKDKLSFERDVYWMKYSGDQKNWAPFDYHGQLYFVQQFQPMHVIAIDRKKNHGDNIVAMKTISRSLQKDILPWNTTLYGSSIRGGTQALLLPDQTKYLALFHTSVINPPDKVILTYFVGALLFNATPPFNIVAMSEVPIYKPQLYDGDWALGSLDYVVFPTSMFLSEDAKHVWVSAGYQDRDGVIMKLNLEGLLNSLKPVEPKLSE